MDRHEGNHAGTRRGFAFPLVLVMALVMAGVLFALDRVVRGYRNQTHRYRDGEVAFYLARSALDSAERAAEVLLEQGPPPPGPAREIYDRVLLSSAQDLDGAVEVLDLPYLERLIPPHVSGEVRVEMKFYGVEPLGLSLPPGWIPSPWEKRGMVEFQAVAVVGSTRRVLAVRRPFRIQERIPTLLGRFSLLLGKNQGTPEDLNALTYVPRLGLFHRSVSRELSWPVTVFSLPSDGRDRTPFQRFGGDPLEAARRGGWVALLGDKPWVLNLTFGPGESSTLEEGFLVRNFESIHTLPGLSKTLKTSRFGLARDLLALPMFSQATWANVPDGSSLFHLSGETRNPTPSLVLGRVFRRFGTFSKVADSRQGPFVSIPELDSDREAEVLQRLDEFLPGIDRDLAAKVQARLEVESYNRSYDAVVSDRTRRDSEGRVVPNETPFLPEPYLSQGLGPELEPFPQGPRNYLYPDPQATSSEYAGGVRIRDDGGQTLFEGSLDELLPALGESLAQRSMWVLEPEQGKSSGEIFQERFQRGGELFLRGTVRLPMAAASLGPFHVRRGGTILVDGKAEIHGPITVAPGEALAIVARQGPLVIANEHPIAAILACTEGEVQPTPRGMDVRGSVVAGSFDVLPWIGLKGAGQIVYDPRLNPSRRAGRAHQTRVFLEDRREVVLRRR